MPAPGAACGHGRDEAGRCLSPAGRLAAAVGSLGFCSNLLVLLLFWRFPAPRSPINLLLLNIALSDLLGCALGTPLGLTAGAAAAPGAACAWRGFATALCDAVVSQKDATDEPELFITSSFCTFVTLLFWHYQFEYFTYKLIDCPVPAEEHKLNK